MWQGESLQGWAEAVAAATAALPDTQLTRAVEAAASEQALRLYERAVQAYGKVMQGPQQPPLACSGPCRRSASAEAMCARRARAANHRYCSSGAHACREEAL